MGQMVLGDHNAGCKTEGIFCFGSWTRILKTVHRVLASTCTPDSCCFYLEHPTSEATGVWWQWKRAKPVKLLRRNLGKLLTPTGACRTRCIHVASDVG